MLRALFVLAILIPGFLAGCLHPFAALLLYVWYAMFRPEAWVWFDLASYRVSLIIGVLLLVRTLMSGILPTLKSAMVVWMGLFLIAATCSQIQAIDPTLAWTRLDEFARMLLVSVLTVTLVSTPTRLFYFVAVLAGSFGIHSSKAGLVSMIAGGARLLEGLAGSFNDNNGYALGTVMVLPLLIATAQNSPYKWLKLGFYAAVPLSTFAIIGLFSRGAFLGLGAALVVFILLQKRKATWLAVVAAVVWLGATFAPIPEGYFERISTIGQASTAVNEGEDIRDVSAAGRLHFWHVAIVMAEENPFGVGLRNYEAAYDSYDDSGGRYGHRRAVHSSLFQVIAEMGFPGLFLYLVLFVQSAITVFRIRRRARRGDCSPEASALFFTMANAIAASQAGFLVGGSFLALAFNDVTWLTFGLLAALDRVSRSMCESTVPARVAAASPAARVAFS
jgi:probable O-glycosylation ligase (exosortase A-associated)